MPYDGAAFCYQGNQQSAHTYRVRAARVVDVGVRFHPFCAGLIVNTSAEGVHVATRTGVVIFSDITDDAGARTPVRKFRVGARLWNSADALLAAQRFRP